MTNLQGMNFLFQIAEPEAIFTPEDLSEEHRMMFKLARNFVDGEILPNMERLESLDVELAASVLRKAGELGLLGAHIPEKYGGSALDFISSTLMTEQMGRSGSLSVAYGNHTGIATWPFILCGTNEQNETYLSALATGKKLGAYALTEPGSGSDARAVKTTAHLSADGRHYIINGQKQWITNAGFADVYIVYAKVAGEHFTAFIVDGDAEGLTTGPEEKKMGISGSSTRMLYLDDVLVPIENVLGEIGQGHIVAFNALNMGRYKVGVGCMGSAKNALQMAAQYANVRHSFGKPLSQLGMIQQKLADMNIRTYVAESVMYRTGGSLDENHANVSKEDDGHGALTRERIADLAVECSINKVLGSEVLDFVVDESLQVHGGYGYMKEYPIEAAYRSSRINRIFEGSNEINRLLIPVTIIRKANKGEIPLYSILDGFEAKLAQYSPPAFSGILSEERQAVEKVKQLYFALQGTALQKFGKSLAEQQEMNGMLADILIEIYAMESAALRAVKNAKKIGEKAEIQISMAQVYIQEALPSIARWAKTIAMAVVEDERVSDVFSLIHHLTSIRPIATIEKKRKIAYKVSQLENYAAIS